MTTRQLTPDEKKVVRRAFRGCTYPWPATFDRPAVEAEQRSGFGYYDYHRNVVVLNDQVIRFAVMGDKTRRKQVKSTVLHETFHAIDYQLLTNEDRRKLAAVLHGGIEHTHTPTDSEHPWGADARDEEKWSDHGHAWWDSKYEESLMEASADAFVQAFSTLTSQTAGRWVHKIIPAVEEGFTSTLLAVTK